MTRKQQIAVDVVLTIVLLSSVGIASARRPSVSSVPPPAPIVKGGGVEQSNVSSSKSLPEDFPTSFSLGSSAELLSSGTANGVTTALYHTALAPTQSLEAFSAALTADAWSVVAKNSDTTSGYLMASKTGSSASGTFKAFQLQEFTEVTIVYTR